MAAQYADIFNYIMGPQNTQWVGEGKGSVDPKYQGIINMVTDTRGGDDPGSDRRVDVDYSKLPNQGVTKYGKIGVGAIPSMAPNTPVAPGQQSTVKDRNLTYYDPNYGWITPASNQRVGLQDKLNSIMPSIIMAAASMGMGSLIGPGMASYLMKAPSFGSGIGNLINRPSAPTLTGGGAVTPSTFTPRVIGGG